MKNKKIIYCILAFVLIIIIVSMILVLNKNKDKNNDNDKETSELKDHTVCEPNSLTEQLLTNSPDKKYLKLNGGEILTEDTSFRNYAFISNNSIYIFNPKKLDSGEFEYKKVYDIPENIKVMNILSGYGASIKFIDYNDTLYTLQDDNLDNKVRDSYDMYVNASYRLSDSLKWEYSKAFLGQKIDYDFMSEYVYAKDNILYRLLYTNDNKYPISDKISGNYEGEKVIRIYNGRILKTDKGFYEIMSYFDKDLNKTVTTTVRINLLTKFYDEILTFTYKYVVLKDYTLIPINDVMENRVRDYSYDSFLSGFNDMSEVRYEE